MSSIIYDHNQNQLTQEAYLSADAAVRVAEVALTHGVEHVVAVPLSSVTASGNRESLGTDPSGSSSCDTQVTRATENDPASRTVLLVTIRSFAGTGGIAVRNVDLNFYFDPVCPFAWMTSKWVRMVAEERQYRVDWRFISLRIINADIDYDAHFPPGYEGGHTAGLRLLRVAARVRAQVGPDAVGPLYEAIGSRVFDAAADGVSSTGAGAATVAFLEPILRELGLRPESSDALDDTALDEDIRAETDEALALTGRDVGTPILHFQPPTGVAFFGPVISRLPQRAEAGALWDNVIGLTSFPGFAELKRSLRERPQLASFGVLPNSLGLQEDWHAGSRRAHK